MNEAWESLFAGVVIVVVCATSALKRKIEWEGGGHTTAEERPILFWSFVVGFGCVGVVAAATGIARLAGWHYR